jgi:dTDP-4-dehydrorhamnose 3,5-epimerase
MDNLADAAFLTPLKIIAHPKGDIFHALKASEASFEGFGEAYFSTIHAGVTKGWKKHLRMHMNLVVPVGCIAFHVHNEARGTTKVFTLSHDNYQRLTVPPGNWLAFEGLSDGLSMLLNIADLEHDPDEAVNVDLNRFVLGSAP